MKILAMDSATERGGVALLDGDDLISSQVITSKRGHVDPLVRALDEQLQGVGWSCGDLDLLAVTQGPGSFAGLRIALGVAKGISLAHGVPVVAVPTMMALAAALPVSPHPVAVLSDARRREIYAALYQVLSPLEVKELMPVGNLPPARLGEHLRGVLEGGADNPEREKIGVHLYGPVVDALGDQLTAVLHEAGLSVMPLPDVAGDGVDSASAPGGAVDIATVGRLGARIFQEGRKGQQGQGDELTPVGLIEPLYVRPADAVAKRMVIPGVTP